MKPGRHRHASRLRRILRETRRTIAVTVILAGLFVVAWRALVMPGSPPG